MDEKVELHAIIHGHVQGVFFRASTCEIAKQLGLTGTVKNLSDGTVEIWAQGPKKQLTHLLKELAGPQGPGQISSIQDTWGEPVRSFDDFRVVY